MYVVSYDISSDRLRAKVAKTLEGYGMRMQYSVFECRLSEKKYKELYAALLNITGDMEDGSIRFYNICGNCEGKIRTIGQITAKKTEIAEKIIVI